MIVTEYNRKIEDILEINNLIIDTLDNEPFNYFKLRFNRFRLNRRIKDILNYISGPSTP